MKYKSQYNILIKEKKNNLSDFLLLFINNYYDIKYIYSKFNKKSQLYINIDKYLKDNNYEIEYNDLYLYLKKIRYKWTYKEIDNLKIVINNIIVDTIYEKFIKEYDKYIEIKNLNNSFDNIKTKESSINNYYILKNDTPNYIYYEIYQKIIKINNPKLYKSFLIALDLNDKNIEDIVNEYETIENDNSILASNLFNNLYSLKNVEIENFYKLVDVEKELLKDKYYDNMSIETKELYRKKVSQKINSINLIKSALKEKKHVGYYLFKQSNPLFSMDYKQIYYSSKTLIVINNKIKSFENIDYLINLIAENNDNNLYFYINTNNNYQYETYYKNKVSNENNENILLELNSDIMISHDIKYVIHLNNLKYFNYNNILKLINIMEHPLNTPIVKNDTYKIINGFAKLTFNTNTSNNNDIYNFKKYNFIYYNKSELDEKTINKHYLNTKHLSKKLYFEKIKTKKWKISEEENVNELYILNNNNYSLITNNTYSYSKFNNINLNNINTPNYINIIHNGRFFNNIPLDNKNKNDYKITYKNNALNYFIEKDNLLVNTLITVSLHDNLEIRKINIKNISNITKKIDIISYVELNDKFNPIYENDIIKINYQNKSLGYKLLGVNDYTYKLNKYNINNDANYLKYNNLNYKDLKSPIISYKMELNIRPGEDTSFYIINFISDYNSFEDDIDKYNINYIESILKTNCNLARNYNTNYNRFINLLINPIVNNNRNDLIKYNNLNTNSLDKYDININNKTILIEIDEKLNNDFIKDLLLFIKYARNVNIDINLIFLLKDTRLKEELEDLVYVLLSSTNVDKNNIIYLNYYELNDKEKVLLYLIPSYIINNSKYISIKNFIDTFYLYNSKDNNYVELLDNNPFTNNLFNKYLPYTNELKYNNSFGGFENNGKTYTITNLNTPIKWKNILINKNMKSYISNNMNYTLFNDNELTIKTDNIYKNLSEKFKINNSEIIWTNISHNPGYSIYRCKTDTLEIIVKEILSLTDNVKIYRFNIINNTDSNIDIKLSFNIKPKMYLDRYISTTHYTDKNIVTFKTEKNNLLFVTSTQKIENTNLNNDEKEIYINLTIKNNENKNLAWTLGNDTYKNVWFLKEKYSNISSIDTAIKITEKTLDNNLFKLNIDTNIDSFNYLLNYWLLYQLYISKDELDIIDYEGIISTFKDEVIHKLRYSKTLNSDYILMLYNYIYITNNTGILNEENYNNIKEYVNNNVKNNFKSLDTIETFIKLTKLYDKNIDITDLNKKSKEITEYLKSNKKDDIIYKSNLLIRDLNNKDDKIYIKDNLDINLYEDNIILYLKVLYKLKLNDALFETFESLNPINRTTTKDAVLNYIKEPYFVDKDLLKLYDIGINYILGIRIVDDKLYIRPHLPEKINNFKFTYRYNSTTYNIEVNKENKFNIVVDGYDNNLDYIRLKNDLKEHTIIVNIKK